MDCLIPQTFPPQEGGIQTYMLNASRGLAKNGVCVLARWQEGCDVFDSSQDFEIQRVYTGNDIFLTHLFGGLCNTLKHIKRLGKCRNTYCPCELRKVMRIISLVDSRHMIYVLQMFSRLLAKEAEAAINIVHIGTVLPSGIVGVLAKQLLGIPFVIYTHAAEINHWQRAPKDKALLLGTLEESAKIVAVCEYVRNQLLALEIPIDKIVKINPGVDSNRYASHNGVEDVRKRYRLGGKIVILTVSHLIARKGHDTILRALPGLIEEFPNLVYLIVGRGPHRSMLEGLRQELGLQKHVVFAGYVDDQNLPAYYNSCDIFAMVTREIGWDIEGFGIVYIEASAAGKPIVAGTAGGVADAVIDGETGVLVDPESHVEVAEALRRLLRSKEMRRRMGENGRQRVKKMFSWERVQKEIQELSSEIGKQNSNVVRN